MGEAKWRREAIARGESDPGIVGFRRRFSTARPRPGLAQAPWAARAESRRAELASIKLTDRLRREKVRAAREVKRPMSPLTVGLTRSVGGRRKQARRDLRTAGGVVG